MSLLAAGGGVGVAVALGVGRGVALGVGRAVAVGRGVSSGVGRAVAVGCGVGRGVGVAVGVGDVVVVVEGDGAHDAVRDGVAVDRLGLGVRTGVDTAAVVEGVGEVDGVAATQQPIMATRTARMSMTTGGCTGHRRPIARRFIEDHPHATLGPWSTRRNGHWYPTVRPNGSIGMTRVAAPRGTDSGARRRPDLARDI